MTLSKLYRFVVAAVLAMLTSNGSAVYAQTVVWETFDDYDADSGIIDQGSWEGWDLGFADGIVYEEESFSEPNSLFLPSGADVVQVISEVNEGRWIARVMTFIPSDMAGNAYFILLNTYAHGGAKDWSTQVLMNVATVSSLGGSNLPRPATSVLPTIVDTWVEVRVEIDLDNGMQQLFYGEDALDPPHAWSAAGFNEIQCVDLFSENSDGCLMDNVSLQEACTARANVEPTSGNAPLEVTFDASESSCPDLAIEAFHWSFGDGDEADSATATHTYTEPGVYPVQLTITDESGLVHVTSSVVGVGCETGDLGPWSSGDVGKTTLPSCIRLADDCMSLSGGGIGVGRTEDNVDFPHQSVTGDFSMTLRVRDLEWPTDGRVGILVRETLEPTSRTAFAHARNQSTGVRARLDRRRTAGGSLTGSQATPEDSWRPPNMWLRMDRVADDILMFASEDGETWEPTRDTTIVGLEPTLALGLVASSGSESTSISVTFCDIDISGPAPEGAVFRRGDADDSGGIELTDAITVLNFLFLGGASPTCLEAADADDNGVLQLTDGVYVLGYLFSGGAAPPDPGPMNCGPDPEGSPELDCESYTNC